MLLRSRQKVFLKDETIVGRFGGPVLFVRPRAKMPPAAVARSVANARVTNPSYGYTLNS